MVFSNGLVLTHCFQITLSLPPEIFRKPEDFLVFSGGRDGALGTNWLMENHQRRIYDPIKQYDGAFLKINKGL